MAKYRITTPDGHEYEVEGPENASDDQIISFARDYLSKAAPGKYDSSPHVVNRPKADLQSTVDQGVTLGASDELAGAAGVLYNAVKAPFSSETDFDPLGSYAQWRDRERDKIDATREQHPWLSALTEGVGSLATIPAGAISRVSSLGEIVKQGGKIGAGLGAAGGFNYGEGFGGSTVGAAIGSGIGGLFGAALPVALQLAQKPFTAARNYLRPQNGIGRELVARAMQEDRILPRMAGERLTNARSNGTPLALMDLGDNLRGLTSALARKPGQSRTLIRETVLDRQAGQGERIRGAISRDLGPIVNPAEQSESLISQARSAARPLYEQAYAEPGRTSPELEALLSTPAGRQAMAKARTIAANEGRDPNVLGFDLDDQGEVVLRNTPGVQTLDYVKRGLDDIVEGYRDPVTRQLNLDESGRAISNLRQNYVSEVDRLYPESYAKARQAYQGPAREREALDLGRKSLNASAEEIDRMVARLSDAERQQFALGHRWAMTEALERKGDAADKVLGLLGTERKRRSLGMVHSGNANLPRFMSTMGDEAAAAETYRAVNTGSQTASRLADDALVEDSSLLEDIASEAIRGGQNGWTGLVATGLNALRDANRFGAGASGNRAREEAAALLSNTDPDLLQEAMRVALRDPAIRRLNAMTFRRRVQGGGLMGARAIGGVSGYVQRPQE